jgi:hypothetical protein
MTSTNGPSNNHIRNLNTGIPQKPADKNSSRSGQEPQEDANNAPEVMETETTQVDEKVVLNSYDRSAQGQIQLDARLASILSPANLDKYGDSVARSMASLANVRAQAEDEMKSLKPGISDEELEFVKNTTANRVSAGWPVA